MKINGKFVQIATALLCVAIVLVFAATSVMGAAFNPTTSMMFYVYASGNGSGLAFKTSPFFELDGALPQKMDVQLLDGIGNVKVVIPIAPMTLSEVQSIETIEFNGISARVISKDGPSVEYLRKTFGYADEKPEWTCKVYGDVSSYFSADGYQTEILFKCTRSN